MTEPMEGEPQPRARVAPVATEQGVFGTLPPPPAARPRGSGRGRMALLWLLGVLLAGALALWLATLSVAQATDERVALPALQRGVASLTGLDALVDLHIEDVQAQAHAGGATLTLPGFPVRDGEVDRAGATRADGGVDRLALREALLRRAARLVYLRGLDAFRDPASDPVDPALVSPSGGIAALLDNLSSDNHGAAVVWLWALGGVCLLLGALLLALGSGLGRFLALGLSMITAALATLVAVLLLRVALAFIDVEAGDVVVEEFVAIARRLTDLPLRNALWLAAAGLAIAVPAALAGGLLERAREREQPEYRWGG